MTYKTGAAFRQALETRLRDKALTSGLPLIRLRKIVAFDRLLARISKQSRSHWVLKGGLALEWQFGDRARTTMDIDATVVRQSSVGELLAELRKAAAENIGDWFEFEVAQPSPGSTGAPFGGYRFPVVCLLDGRIFERFRVDVGIGDPIIGTPRLITGPGLLGFAGIRPSRVRCYPQTSQIAEKLHAYTRPHAGPEGTRVKDLVDILLIASSVPIKAQLLRKAINATFQARATHESPSSLPPPPPGWTLSFARMAADLRLPWKTLKSATESAAAFLDPVLDGTARSGWHPSDWTWH